MARNADRFFAILAALAAVAPTTLAAPPAGPRGNIAGQIARPLHYRPDGTDFVTHNGPEFFNRPLYGINTAFRIDAGDRPEFSLYLPGRGGNLRLGFQTRGGVKWFAEARSVTARYRPGSMLYDIHDPLLGGGSLQLTALPMSATKGLVVRVLGRNAPSPVTLIWAYGGANGQKGARNGDIGCESVPVSQFFQLKPEYCRDNTFILSDGTFTLQSPAGAIIGLMPPGATQGVADAAQWASPRALLASVGQATPTPVVVGQARLRPNQPLYLGLERPDATGAVSDTPAGLPGLFDAAERRRRAVAQKIVVDTPDPYINAAAAALCVAADGVWDEQQGAFMHGAVAWRTKLLGWRGPYSGDALGWHDRTRRHLTYWAGRQDTGPIPTTVPPPDPAFRLTRNEAALHSNGDMSHSHYDMNLVSIDALFRHFLWTGDLRYARQEWPVIQRHLAWERRLFRRPFGPEKLPLYEAYCCIWASDDLQYEGGGVTHASAYNYFHNRMAARLARLLHEDSTPYDREAALIWKGMHQNLWLGDRGWYAEYKDLLGLQRVHPNAALWTLYHTVDSDAATPMEAWQMTRFVDTQIPHIPLAGLGVPVGCFTLPTTTWMPYTWSTNNVVMAESAHTALAYWQAGRDDVAFRLFKGCLLDSMYLGLCPGNAGMTTAFDDARREAQRDFADGVGMDSRALIEGLFGLHPDALAGELRIRPGFPAAWNRAALRHSDLTFSFRRLGLTDTYTVAPHFPRPMALRLQAAAPRDTVAAVTVNGKPTAWKLVSDAIGTPRVEIQAAPAPQDVVRITWSGRPFAPVVAPLVAALGGTMRVGFGPAVLKAVADPQHALSRLTRTPKSFQALVTGTQGDRTVFAHVRQGNLAWWQPVIFQIRPAYEIVPAAVQEAGHLRFAVRNNTSVLLDRAVTLRFGGRVVRSGLRVPAFGQSPELAPLADGLPPGATPVVVEWGTASHQRVGGLVTNWHLQAGPRQHYECLNLTPILNDRVTQIFQNRYLSPRSPYCSLAIPEQGIGGWCDPKTTFAVDDGGLRAASDRGQGRLMLPPGIPLQTTGSGDGKNIAFTSRWDNYPHAVTAPLHGRATHAYLLMAGSTNSMQSRFDNGEVTVTYADGSMARLALQNPTNWWPIEQDYLTDDFAFRRPGPIPPRVDLKSGTVRFLDPVQFKGQGGKSSGGAATVLDLPLDSSKSLQSLTVRTLANDVVIGVMSVTLARKGGRDRRKNFLPGATKGPLLKPGRPF